MATDWGVDIALLSPLSASQTARLAPGQSVLSFDVPDACIRIFSFSHPFEFYVSTNCLKPMGDDRRARPKPSMLGHGE